MTNPMTDHPNYPFMQADSIFYAIEIEVAIPTSNLDFAIGGYHNGLQVPHYPQGWTAEYDSSLSAQAGYTPLEIVSPKLKGFDGIVQVVQVLDDLAERGAITNDSMGLHIHVDGRNLDIRDIKKVKQMYVQYEKLFFGVMGDKAITRYENNTYCKPSCQWADGQEHLIRFRSLNLKNWYNYQQKKTIEFRLFAGELNPEKVVTYLMMCVGLVVYARNCTRVHKFGTAPSSLKDLCKKFISNVMKHPCNQIVPGYTPKRGESLFQVLYDNVPDSTVSL